MSVKKTELLRIEPKADKTFQGKKSLQSDIQECKDEEKRNAAQYMTGASAISAAAAADIIGQKNKGIKNTGETVGKNIPNAELSAKDTSSEIQKRNRIDSNENTEMIFRKDGTLESVIKHDPITGKVLIEIYLKGNGKTIELVKKYDSKTGNLSKTIAYAYADDNTPSLIKNYDPISGVCFKETEFYENGKKASVKEFDRDEGFCLKKTEFYRSGGKASLIEYDPETRKRLQETKFYKNGNTALVRKYDSRSGILVEANGYYRDGTNALIKIPDEYYDTVFEYNPLTVKKSGSMPVSVGGERIVETYTPGDDRVEVTYSEKMGKRLKDTVYYGDSDIIQAIVKYNTDTDRPFKLYHFDLLDGKMDFIAECNPKSGEWEKRRIENLTTV